MAKKKVDKNSNISKPETLYGQKVIKSGSARATMPSPKPKNTMQLDYKNLEYKKIPPTINIHLKDGEDRFPPGSKAPNTQKYDKKGKYIKHTFVATPKKKTQKNSSYVTELRNALKESALSNPKNANARKQKIKS